MCAVLIILICCNLFLTSGRISGEETRIVGNFCGRAGLVGDSQIEENSNRERSYAGL